MSEHPPGDQVATTPTPSRWARLKSVLWTGNEPDHHLRWLVRNDTPWPVCAHGYGSRVFSLAPFEQRLVTDDPRKDFPIQRLVDRGKVRVEQRVRRHDQAVVHAVRIVAVLAFLWLVSGLLLPGTAWRWAGAVLGTAGAVLLFCLLTRPGRLADVRQVQRWTWQSATMAVVLVVAVLAPALALWFGTDLHRTVELGSDRGIVYTAQPLELIGRALQLTLIAVASLLPALMFFQFDAERLSTQRDRWVQNIFRLDPTVSTLTDVEAKYGSQIEEAYGSSSDGRGRLTRGRRSPLIVATIVITFGWLLILINADVRLGTPGEPNALPFTELVAPLRSPIAYAFIGAYFFALNLVHHSYVRGDLRPKTYNLVTARILIVVILAWLIQLAFAATRDSEIVYLLAFAAGLVPRTVLHLALEKLPLMQPINAVTGTGDDLSTLDGIDLYERTRLSDEGVTTLQAMANHDLVDLFFKTRISAPRLIDWVDQATLQVYVSDLTAAGATDFPAAIESLRKLSIRTATEFLVATDPEQPEDRRPTEALIARALGWTPAEAHERIVLLRNALITAEWSERILYWQGSRLTAADARDRLYVDGDGDLVKGDPRFRLRETATSTAERMDVVEAAFRKTADARMRAGDSSRRAQPSVSVPPQGDGPDATPSARDDEDPRLDADTSHP